MNHRRRILMITRNFPPTIGGMERLAHHAYLELGKEFDVWLLGPTGSGKYASDSVRVVECRTRPLVAFLSSLQWHARRLVRAMGADLVLGSSGISSLGAVAAARAAGVPSITCVHGLDLVVRNMVYRALFIPAIRRSDRVIANSRYTAELACGIGVAKDAIDVVHPGVAVHIKDSPSIIGFRARYGLSGRKVLLSVGRLLPRKGLPEFIRNVMPELVAKHADVVLAIVGEEPRQALAARPGEMSRIQESAISAGMSQHVSILGAIEDDILAQAYADSDLFVFPLQEMPGDIEGFGMVAVEAAARGLPTVAFSVGGVTDAVSEGVSGYLIEPGNYRQMARIIVRYLDTPDREGWRARCIEYAKEFSWDRYGVTLREICYDTIEKRTQASA